MNQSLFTSESVSEGHPDKICDQIADNILDYIIDQDPNAKVAIEVFATTNFLLIGGQVSANFAVPDGVYEQIARNTLKEIGYVDKSYGIDYQTCEILIKVEAQSSDIAVGVDLLDGEIGAGDQGIMFGYATNEAPTMLPLPISIAHDLVQTATQLRKSGEFKHARPDMKSQVTIDYQEPNHPRIATILMSIQHDPEVDIKEFKAYIHEKIMKKVARDFGLNTDFKVLINPTGRFVIGGPQGDTGLTGRKIIVDTYGGSSRHGGGAFSGKDATKVDRSGAYMSRYVAKNLVAAGYADRLEIQVGYAIGEPNPVSIAIESFGTQKVNDEVILAAINQFFDFSVGGMIETLKLREPIFKKTSTYGHFGKNELPWEQLDKVEELKAFLKTYSK
ncbi:S-adenosylmethionine synthase [Mesoplasma sp. JKS002658]|uniref:methionine adenosyltransferase n=1 Tax=Mesoplasma whartonense TaxID=2878854 RepID=UPI002022A4A2|nr:MULTISPECIES: methionine adenosyltransferase [unclassified Mesoplasma]MCL8211488.1 S-adenosylmethionine synthase [Mesoplasma sp. JKS002664]MCL8211948.1 S-adenosylmethionine synthase [Mesoplasma sp. JKS002662]MCL8213568.1 S-adenosylmethionine synthase [Mesoplasma sp. JKS002660]MCL8213947.1 S-adenosylmethionine synthase [Mesoplasma sp. JKS002658]MCL8214913.1 S-adenosylmethionine synthase [Mesoplasma sp. JKS002663]